jgi:hypothetical protein
MKLELRRLNHAHKEHPGGGIKMAHRMIHYMARMALAFSVFWLADDFDVSLAAGETAAAAAGQTTPNLLVIPQPKSLRPGTGTFVWKRDAHWQLQAPARDERLWQAAGGLLASRQGQFVTNSHAGCSLQIGMEREVDFPAGTNQPAWAANPEGYRLSVTPKGIVLQAATAQGAFYGLQTLGQLLECDARQLSCPAVEVEDWPSLRFRGVHWFPSASGAPMYRQLIDNVFPTLKLNHCVVECEAARWDCHPEIAMTNSISKADLRQLVEECRSRFIEPVPLVDVPGHAQWMFQHDENLDLVEDSQTTYACCVKNPKTIRFIEAVMTECIDVFHPKTFHIGYDEITQRGQFPNPQCPLCGRETTTSLITESANRLADWLAARGIKTMMWGDMLLAPGEAADATNRLADWLAARGIKTMMWGDMLLGPGEANAKNAGEAKERRTGISKKITITDWHYWNPGRRSLDVLQQAGFHTIASTWMQPGDIFRFSQAAIASGSDGLLQTTWDGYFPDERVMQHEIDQFSAYVLAADYAWSGRSDPPAKLGYDARKILLKAYAGKFSRPQLTGVN